MAVWTRHNTAETRYSSRGANQRRRSADTALPPPDRPAPTFSPTGS
jgi:hypothetical protein